MIQKLKLNDGIDYWELAQTLGIRGVPTGDHLYACCPFHAERHPSFSLDLERGLWFCHTEQRGGDFPALVSEALDVGRMAARRWILEKSARLRPVDLAEKAEPPMPRDIDIEAYVNVLSVDTLPMYWFERGFTWETADRWDVRYDKHARRIVIPVRFPHPDGTLVGYVSRTVVDERPKYRNSPNLAKEAVFFGYRAQHDPEAILLTEGPLDVLRLDQCGREGWAVLGSTMSEAHWRMLGEYPGRVILAFDNDSVGRSAIWRSVSEGLVRRSMLSQARVFRFPPGVKDIGECTPQQIENGIRQAQLLLGWRINNGRTRPNSRASEGVPRPAPKRWQPKPLDQSR